MPATLEKKPMAKKQIVEVELTSTAIVEVPLSPMLTSVEYAARNVELTLTPEQAATLKRIHKQLDTVGARMSDGRYITRPGHAVQWLLDQVIVSAG
jgi:hypothetical protein